MAQTVRAIDDDGRNMSDELVYDVSSIDRWPIDDSIANGPHASAKRETQRTPRAGSQWAAATMRLEANKHRTHCVRCPEECPHFY